MPDFAVHDSAFAGFAPTVDDVAGPLRSRDGT
jgi:hypothetical protein